MRLGMNGLLLLGLLMQALPAVASERPELDKPAHVPWRQDLSWEQAVAVAGGADRPILLDFWAPWCGPCKLLDGFVFNEPAVIAELADVLTLKVDIDRPENDAIRERFNVSVLPTLVWCEPSGQEVDRFTGSVSAEEFLELVRTMRQDGNTFQRLREMVDRRPQEPGLLFDLARRHAERGETRRAGVLYRRLMALRYRADKRVVVDGMLGLANLEQAAGNPERARDIVRRAGSAYAVEEAGCQEVLMAVAAYQGALPDTVGMLDTYRRLIDFDDTQVSVLAAYARTAARAGVDLEQATRYAIRAVVMGDDAPHLMALVAQCYAARESHGRAVRWMKKACAADPANPAYAADLERYRQAVDRQPYRYRGRRR